MSDSNNNSGGFAIRGIANFATSSSSDAGGHSDLL